MWFLKSRKSTLFLGMYLLFSNTFSVSPGQLVNELCFLSVGDSLRAEVPKINIYI